MYAYQEQQSRQKTTWARFDGQKIMMWAKQMWAKQTWAKYDIGINSLGIKDVGKKYVGKITVIKRSKTEKTFNQ